MNQNQSSNIVIIGGGIAGACSAIALANQGIDGLVVMDNQKSADTKIGENLPPSANVLMKKLGIHNGFLNLGFQPAYSNASLWGSDKLGYNDHILSPHGHGWNIDRVRFEALLKAEAIQRGVHWMSDTRFVDAHKLPSNAYKLALTSTDGAFAHEAKIVIDASGYRSCFAVSQGISRQQDTQLICVYSISSTTDSASDALSKMSVIEASESGWWYSAPLPEARRITAFFTLPSLYKTLHINKKQSWLDLLNSTLKVKSVANLTACNIKTLDRCFAGSSAAQRVVGSRWLAVGDAACTFDPLTAHGMTKAMDMALNACDVIVQATRRDTDALLAYDATVQRQYLDYLTGRAFYYQQEQRWPQSLFWQTMHKQKTPAEIQLLSEHAASAAGASA